MTIQIPVKQDRQTQLAFKNVQDQLTATDKKVAAAKTTATGTGSVSPNVSAQIAQIQAEIAALQNAPNRALLFNFMLMGA